MHIVMCMCIHLHAYHDNGSEAASSTIGGLLYIYAFQVIYPRAIKYICDHLIMGGHPNLCNHYNDIHLIPRILGVFTYVDIWLLLHNIMLFMDSCCVSHRDT